jgi:hypothetical protein
MRNFMLVVCSLVFWVGASAAKDKISSQWHCNAKPAVDHSIEVGDHDGHTYHLVQGSCISEKGSMGDAKEQEGSYTEFDDITPGAVKNHGTFVVTLASGDKVFYDYHGTQTLKDSKVEAGSNTWTLAGGSGKFETVKGEGGCKGKGNPDGSSLWNCDGTYSTGK